MKLPIEFDLEDVTTWGLEVDYRYGGYKLPLLLKDFPTTRDQISIFAETTNVKCPLYGKLDVIYLRVYNLSEKQQKEILNKGKLKLHVIFSLMEVNENKRGNKFLHFVVTGISRVDSFCPIPPPKDL